MVSISKDASSQRTVATSLKAPRRRRARVVKGMDWKPIVISRVGSSPTIDAKFQEGARLLLLSDDSREQGQVVDLGLGYRQTDSKLFSDTRLNWIQDFRTI